MTEMEKEKLPNIITCFMNGAKKGCNLLFFTVIPSIVMAFVVMRLLTLSGLMDIIGKALSPFMMIFGLPGEAAMPLVLSFTSSVTAGVSATVALIESGVLTPDQALMMMPHLFLMGGVFIATGRILAVTGIDTKHFKICYAISVIIAILSLFVMRAIIAFM